MSATRLPRLHVITDTRGPVARPSGDPASGPAGAPVFADAGRDPLSVVAAALAAGARLVQVRPEDHYNDRAAFDLATAIAGLCDEHGALCLVNDRVHIAQAVGADGVHLGVEDLPIDAARRLLPSPAIIGGTCRDPESARAARRAGATYLGVGPVWGTTTKAGLPQPIGLSGLAAVCEAVDLPVIAIGGITAERAARCREAGAHGVAVVGAIANAGDPGHATTELLAAVGESSTTPVNAADPEAERRRIDLGRSARPRSDRGGESPAEAVNAPGPEAERRRLDRPALPGAGHRSAAGAPAERPRPVDPRGEGEA